MGRDRILIVALLLVAIFRPIPVDAEGALAVGVPADVAKQGVSLGSGFNYSTADGAKGRALEECRNIGSAISKQLCAIVTTFHNQCFAFSIDPEAGTPGFGWAIADELQSAKQQALANCQRTAGQRRRDFCEVSSSGCDGSAK